MLRSARETTDAAALMPKAVAGIRFLLVFVIVGNKNTNIF